MDNNEQKKYDIGKMIETINRERKMNSDFDDENDCGMNFFETLEKICEQIKENEQNKNNGDKNDDR